MVRVAWRTQLNALAPNSHTHTRTHAHTTHTRTHTHTQRLNAGRRQCEPGPTHRKVDRLSDASITEKRGRACVTSTCFLSLSLSSVLSTSGATEALQQRCDNKNVTSKEPALGLVRGDNL